jgi:hypothetical protein
MGGTKDLVFKEPKEPVHLARTARMNDFMAWRKYQEED